MSREWGAAPAGNWPSSYRPAKQKAAGTRECHHRAESWEERGLGTPDVNLEKHPPVRFASGATLPWAGPPSSASAAGRRGEWSPGETGRRRFRLTPGGGTGNASCGASPARVQSSARRRVTTCCASRRAVSGTGAARGLDRASLGLGGEGSWKRRPGAATERGCTDTCWRLVVTAGKLPARTGRLRPAPAVVCLKRLRLSQDKFGS